jgi:hypothetical protein
VSASKTSTSSRDQVSHQNSQLGQQHTPDAPCNVPTYGELGKSGHIIELVRPFLAGPLGLHFFDGKTATVSSSLQVGDRLLKPPSLSASIHRVVRLPEKSLDFLSTAQLFKQVCELFAEAGFDTDVVLAATYFAFATWFADVLPAAPCLLITGPRLEAGYLLQLLSLVVHHPLPISELNRRVLVSLPMQLKLTLLINSGGLCGSSLELLRISSHHKAFLSVRDGLVDVFCAKAVFCGQSVAAQFIDESALQLRLAPFRELPVNTDRNHSEGIARNLQSKFLAYRCQYIQNVQASQFDLSTFPSETRILAKVLGAPIVDAPELQRALVPLLEKHVESRRADRWTDVQSVALEAVMHHIHKDPGGRVQVGEITRTVMGILKGRGDPTPHDPREIGTLLRDFGLVPKRRSDGFIVSLDFKASQTMHRLANGLGLLAIQNTKCSDCTEIADAHPENGKK